MRQNEHRLQNVDPQRSCCSLGALAVQLYQQLIRAAEKRLKPMIGMAWAWGARSWDTGSGRECCGQLCERLALLQRLYPEGDGRL